MRAVCFHGERDIRVDDVEMPELVEPTDAIVRVTTAAVCGTDLHLFHDKTPGLEPGMVCGHEFVGVVESVGDGVGEIEVGGRYVAAMYTACGRCASCMAGEHRNCAYMAMFGMGPMGGDLAGGQAEYVRVPLADMTLSPVPDHLADEDVLFVGDILSTAYSGLVAAGTRRGDTVAVVGAGPLGQLAVMCAPLFGAARVIAVDLVPERLAAAEALGAIPANPNDVDPLDVVFDHTNNQGADVVLECVGSEPSLATAFSLARTGGSVALLGVLIDEEWPLSAGEAFLKGLSIHAVIGDPFEHRAELLRLIEAGRLRPADIVTHTMALDDAAEAYARFDAKEIGKVVLKP